MVSHSKTYGKSQFRKISEDHIKHGFIQMWHREKSIRNIFTISNTRLCESRRKKDPAEIKDTFYKVRTLGNQSVREYLAQQTWHCFGKQFSCCLALPHMPHCVCIWNHSHFQLPANVHPRKQQLIKHTWETHFEFLAHLPKHGLVDLQ